MPEREKKNRDARGEFKGVSWRPHIRPRTWNKLKRWGFIFGAASVAAMIIGSFALQAIPQGSPNTSGTSSNEGANVGDHWHADLSVNICGKELQFEASPGTDGVHSHGWPDTEIHIHPSKPQHSGSYANLGRFFDSVGMTIDSDTIQSPMGIMYQKGDTCPNGKAGSLRATVNNNDITDKLRSYILQDGDSINIEFN